MENRLLWSYHRIDHRIRFFPKIDQCKRSTAFSIDYSVIYDESVPSLTRTKFFSVYEEKSSYLLQLHIKRKPIVHRVQISDFLPGTKSFSHSEGRNRKGLLAWELTSCIFINNYHSLFLAIEKKQFLLRETTRIYLNNTSIESSFSLDYKYVIFSLAQIRPYILWHVKGVKTPAADIKLHNN